MTPLQRFRALSWSLLEHKFRYYVLNEPLINDVSFDLLEQEYRQLGHELNLKPTAVDMVDFDWKRPSCQVVARKILGAKFDEDVQLHEDGYLYKNGNRLQRKRK